MRIALCGDLHLGRSLYGFDLSPYIQRCMWDFFALCSRLRVDAAVQLGDIFDRPTPTEEQRKIVAQWCNEFERAGIPLFILVGNHDAMAKHGASSALQYLKAGSKTSNPWIVDRPLVLSPGDDEQTNANLVFLPFPSSGIYDTHQEYEEDVEEALEDLDQRHQNIFFAHLNVDGAKLGNQEFVYRGADYSLPELIGKAPNVFCGHIHKPQTIRGVEVVGAADRLRFDESGQERFFGLVTVDPERQYEPDGITFKRYLRTNALNLVELEIDASGMNRPERAPNTEEVIADIARADINRAIIKITPFVDKHTMVDWSAVQNWLYADGAVHVHLAPPTHIKQESKRKSRKAVTVKEPEQAARSFIKERVTSEKERACLIDQFLQCLKGVQDDR